MPVFLLFALMWPFLLFALMWPFFLLFALMWPFFVVCFDVAVFCYFLWCGRFLLFALMWPFFVVCFDMAVFVCNDRFVFDALFMSFFCFKLWFRRIRLSFGSFGHRVLIWCFWLWSLMCDLIWSFWDLSGILWCKVMSYYQNPTA
jgi:hypothetical protein